MHVWLLHGSWDWESSPHTWRNGLYTGPSLPVLIKCFLCAQPKLFLTDKDSALLLRCIGEKNHECMHRICLIASPRTNLDLSVNNWPSFSKQTEFRKYLGSTSFQNFPSLGPCSKTLISPPAIHPQGIPGGLFPEDQWTFTPYIYTTRSRQPLTHNVEVFTFPLAVELLSLYLISFINLASLSICNRSESSPLSGPLSSPALTDTLFLWHTQ